MSGGVGESSGCLEWSGVWTKQNGLSVVNGSGCEWIRVDGTVSAWTPLVLSGR